MTSFIFPRRLWWTGIFRVDFASPEVKLEEVAVHEVYSERLGFSRLYTDKNELLVLVSGGESWSVDENEAFRRNLLMDARIVRFYYDTYIAPLIGKPCFFGCGLVCECRVPEKPMKDFLESLGIFGVYLEALQRLNIEVIPPKTKFRLTERVKKSSLMNRKDIHGKNRERSAGREKNMRFLFANK